VQRFWKAWGYFLLENRKLFVHIPKSVWSTGGVSFLPPPPRHHLSLFRVSVTWLKTSALPIRRFDVGIASHLLLIGIHFSTKRIVSGADVSNYRLRNCSFQFTHHTKKYLKSHYVYLREKDLFWDTCRVTALRTDCTEHHWRIHLREPPCILFYVKMEDYINITVCNCREE
jgi:hypothetical protein